MSRNALVRRTNEAKFAGVCAGVARYLGVDPTMVRLAFVLCAVFSFGSPFLIYLVLWIFMPEG